MVDDAEIIRRYGRVEDESKVVGINAALKCDKDFSWHLQEVISDVFGRKWQKKFAKIRNDLGDKYGENISALFTMAFRVYIQSIYESAAYISKIRRHDKINTLIDNYDLTTPEGNANYHGLAWSIYSGEISHTIKSNELLKGLPFDVWPNEIDLLHAMAIIWFLDATRILSDNKKEAFDLLFEASDAVDLANGIFMWNDCEQDTRKTITGNAAASMAKMRHKESYADRNFVEQYYRDNIDKSLSAQKAATLMIKDNVVNLSHKTIAEIVSALRNKEGLRKK